MGTKRIIWGVPILGLLACALPLPATSAVTFFDDEQQWLDAIGGSRVDVEDFESTPAQSFPAGTTDIGLFDIFIDQADANDRIRLRDPGPINRTRNFQGDVSLDDPIDRGANIIEFRFEQPVVGFAGTFFDTEPNIPTFVTLNVNGESLVLGNVLPNPNGFVGAVDLMSPFTSISFTASPDLPDVNDIFEIDDVRLAAPIPLPGAVWLMMTALIGLILSRHPIASWQPRRH